jgi:uncharacterized protein (DUF849 family)
MSVRKVIITYAPTGAIHTPSMSPYLPVTPAEIAEAGIAAAEAGAAVLHLHARDPDDGRPRQDPAIFREFLPAIGAATDAVINITTGGSPHMTVSERLAPAVDLKPELASLNMGSMNFGLYPMLGRFKEFRYGWEREHLEKSRDVVFRNTFADIERILESCRAFGTRFEFECYDIGHLYNLAHFLDRGLVEPPLFVQSVFGILGGTLKISCTCAARPTACSAATISGRSSVQDASRSSLRVSARRWARTCASASRTRCGAAPGGSPNRAPSRSE